MAEALFMANALSLDGFGVGLTYGLRRIRIPAGPMAVITLCTVLAMGISMLFGSWVMSWLRFIPATVLGGLILVGLGLFQSIRAWRRYRGKKEDADETSSELFGHEKVIPALAGVTRALRIEPIIKIDLRTFGLVIQVLRTPQLADVDRSGGALKESFLLGSALSMDAFGSGIGAGLAGMPLSVIAEVALTQLAMLRLGQQLAGKIPAGWLKKADFLPGFVLTLIGLGKIGLG